MTSPPPEDGLRTGPRVGLVYDERMGRHATPDGERHPENPDRIRVIWNKLLSEGIPERCVVLPATEVEDKHLMLVHTENYIKLIKNISSKKFASRRQRIASNFNSIYFNDGSTESAYLAAGSVIDVAVKVARGDLTSGIAIVRPPGHHAEPNEAMGFCLFNNVAVTASFLLNERPELGIKKILIVDWDVHHGNGTQKAFYKDSRVLFFSVHRFDFGSFYPAGDDGDYCMTGEGPGAGYNVNVPWEHGRCGDADYIAVWDHILIPIAEAYNPDIILISAGFDAAIGDPLGGCSMTPFGYSILLQKLMRFAKGRIIMALEGGYNLKSIANSVLACARVLLQEDLSGESIRTEPFESTLNIIKAVRQELKSYWPILTNELPKSLTTLTLRPSPVEVNSSSSDSDVENDERPSNSVCSANVTENIEDNLAVPFSKLDINEDNSVDMTNSSHVQMEGRSVTTETCHNSESPTLNISLDGLSWRFLLSKIEIWYGCYGSNMWMPRFLCYIEGGKVKGMSTRCSGSLDKSSPKDAIWKTVPHQLLFGRSCTRTWGVGGVAFLNPETSENNIAYMRMYRITLEQFNDVLAQENCLHQDNGRIGTMESPFIGSSCLDTITQNGSLPLEDLKGGWYSNVLYLGKEDGLPILTMTCHVSDIEKFRSGEVPLSAPAREYKDTLVNGLVEGKQLTREEAEDYINVAVSREL